MPGMRWKWVLGAVPIALVMGCSSGGNCRCPVDTKALQSAAAAQFGSQAPIAVPSSEDLLTQELQTLCDRDAASQKTILAQLKVSDPSYYPTLVAQLKAMCPGVTIPG